MKIITLGNGFIANHLPYEIANYRLTPNQEDIGSFLDQYKPEVVINGIGFCGRPNVDQCEVEKTKTYMSNVVLPLMLAEECERRDIQMIHIGSGCIFFGESPNQHCVQADGSPMPEMIPVGQIGSWAQAVTIQYPTRSIDDGWKETDFANPKSYYSKTKYACDLALGQMKNVATLRIRMPVFRLNNPRNFINKVRGYSKVIDVPNSMTFVDDLVQVVDWVIDNSKTGLYHVVNPGPLSAADVMREFQKHVPEHKFESITEAELDTMTVAKRSNCIINGDKLRNEGFEMTPSDIALEQCMTEYAKSI